MIYYFSGTGNSRRIASSLSKRLNEDFKSIPDCNPITEYVTGNQMGIVSPVYAWGIPPIVIDFINHLPEKEILRIKSCNIPVWVVLSYGDDAGNALSIIDKALRKRGLKIMGAWGVISPNVYVLLPGFDVDEKMLEEKKLRNLESRCIQIATNIRHQKWETDVYRGSLPKIKTEIVYPIFKLWGINTKKWRCNNIECIGCGKCEKVCPVKNITMKVDIVNKRSNPIWGPDCTSCCACYHVCPTHSISYGNFTNNKGQYQP